MAVMADYNQRSRWAKPSVAAARSMRRAFTGWKSRSATTLRGLRRGRARRVDARADRRELSQVYDMQKALDARACDLVMPDLERIGGVTGWQRASALAAGAGLPMSSHLYPEVSAHLLAATPTAHWLEYVDWMNPLLVEPLKIVDGMAVVSDRPGLGLMWNHDMVRKYAA